MVAVVKVNGMLVTGCPPLAKSRRLARKSDRRNVISFILLSKLVMSKPVKFLLACVLCIGVIAVVALLVQALA
jgi:hypothetical protein